MENTILIQVKAVLIGEYNDFNSWLNGNQAFRNSNGITTPTLHQDCNGFATNGFDLRNTKKEAPYPVKSYLLVQDPDVEQIPQYNPKSKNVQS